MPIRRRRGATLGLVAIVALVVIILGFGIFVLVRILGGGRELAHATDSGVLNVAKLALRQPSKSAFSFSNPDVGTNFALLGEGTSNLNLMVYNRLVAQAALVALNARDENTSQSGQNARKVWTALNDVAQFLRSSHESNQVVGGFFQPLAGLNNLKMLGNHGISMTDNSWSFMRRGGSTNVFVNPAVLATTPSGTMLPVNSSGVPSPGGHRYMAGYTPLVVSLPAIGDSLTFSGVPVGPQDRPHLVSLSQFNQFKDDAFATAVGYPASTLPVNSFMTGSVSREDASRQLAGAVACAIVGCLDSEYEMKIPYGYLVIKNGPSATAPPQEVANARDDIFHFELGLGGGIYSQGTAPSNLFTTEGNLFSEWADHNQNGGPRPDVPHSQAAMNKVDGSAVTVSDLEGITTRQEDVTHCVWSDYDQPMSKTDCLTNLPAFKSAYGRPGSVDNDPGHWRTDGYTAHENFKINVLRSRIGATTCVSVAAPGEQSGVKRFGHGSPYIAPGGPGPNKYNFGHVATPYEYLEMIDSLQGMAYKDVIAGENKCALTSTMTSILKRCQQIKPSYTRQELDALLNSQDLPLGATLYIYASGSNLVMSQTPPSWMVPGTVADGGAASCGEPYRIMGETVNVRFTMFNATAEHFGDGDFNFSPFTKEPEGTCQDAAIWTPSSGYNNLLGELRFQNSCSGGGFFCQPN